MEIEKASLCCMKFLIRHYPLAYLIYYSLFFFSQKNRELRKYPIKKLITEYVVASQLRINTLFKYIEKYRFHATVSCLL